MPTEPLTVAVTGATGTIGRALLPILDEDRAVGRVVALATHAFSPGLAKVDARVVDVRDRTALDVALSGADVVVHLAFKLSGVRQSSADLHAINVEGSRNVLAAAARAGARRFVYTSSAAVYGFHRTRSSQLTEAAPVAPEPRHFYSRHKAELERRLRADLAKLDMEWIMFRPCAVVGPGAVGSDGGGPLGALVTIGGAAGLRPVVPGPPVPLQFVHQSDVARAIQLAITSEATDAVYNLGGEGMVAPADVPRLLGLRTLPVPRAVTKLAFAAAARLPNLVPALGWPQLLTQPLELDSTRARSELGWRPQFTSAEALASTRRALAL